MREALEPAECPGDRGLTYEQTLRVVECCPIPTLVDMVRHRIDMAHRLVYLTSGSLIPNRAARSAALQRSLCEALDRNVRLLLLDNLESLEASARRSLLNEVLRRGAEIRLSPYTATGLLIVDDTAAIACDNPVFDHSDCRPTRSKAVIKLLQQFADMTWRTSWDLEAAAIVSQEARLDVLRHLCAGYKDEVGARFLNMSLRTYRRHVADLLRMLGANSRFEAGARAVALGLLN